MIPADDDVGFKRTAGFRGANLPAGIVHPLSTTGPGLGVEPDKNQCETTKADAIQRVLPVGGEHIMFPGAKAVWTRQRID